VSERVLLELGAIARKARDCNAIGLILISRFRVWLANWADIGSCFSVFQGVASLLRHGLAVSIRPASGSVLAELERFSPPIASPRRN
jgi:hypothetical protein